MDYSSKDYSELNKTVSFDDVQKSEKQKEDGNAFVKNNNYEKALDCYTRAINLNPPNPLLYCNRSLVYLKYNNYQKAIEDCSKAIFLKTDYVKAYQRRGKAYLELKDYSKALKDFVKIVETEPSELESYNDFLLCISKLLEKQSESKPSLKSEIPIPENEVIRENIFIHEDLYFYDSHDTVFHCIEKVQFCEQTAIKLSSKGFYKQAIQKLEPCLELLINLNPLNPAAVYNAKARLYNSLSAIYIKRQNYYAAIQNSDAVLRIPTVASKTKVEALISRINALELLKNYESALQDANQILLIDNKNQTALLKTERYNSIINHTEIARPIQDKNQLESFIKKIEGLKEDASKYFSSGDYKKAVSGFSDSIKEVFKVYTEANAVHEPDVLEMLTKLYNNRALAYFKQDLYDLCIQDCLYIISLGVSSFKLFYRIAKCHESCNNLEDAIKAMKIVTELDPKNVVALKQYESYLKSLEISQDSKPDNISITEVKEPSPSDTPPIPTPKTTSKKSSRVLLDSKKISEKYNAIEIPTNSAMLYRAVSTLKTPSEFYLYIQVTNN